ncbi:hypothetical protein BaRGS_00024060 [Batillaria attramentaria]|uniref:Uncharacterized protein n=1 Tax=Batillaria attramentaria TaxID=370345 RepID=A0ABD0KC73_9CAEN
MREKKHHKSCPYSSPNKDSGETRQRAECVILCRFNLHHRKAFLQRFQMIDGTAQVGPSPGQRPVAEEWNRG